MSLKLRAQVLRVAASRVRNLVLQLREGAHLLGGGRKRYHTGFLRNLMDLTDIKRHFFMIYQKIHR